MFKTRQVRRLEEEKRAAVLRCASDRVSLAIEAESFREATGWMNLVASGVAFLGPKLSMLAPAVVGLFVAKSARLGPPKLIRLGKMALVGWKLVRAGWAFWQRVRAPRTLAGVN